LIGRIFIAPLISIGWRIATVPICAGHWKLKLSR
jgi:hypothetical protein